MNDEPIEIHLDEIRTATQLLAVTRDAGFPPPSREIAESVESLLRLAGELENAAQSATRALKSWSLAVVLKDSRMSELGLEAQVAVRWLQRLATKKHDGR